MTAGYVWRANVDGVDHAHRPRHSRTLCGELVLPERHAWPKTRTCPTCERLAQPVRVMPSPTRNLP